MTKIEENEWFPYDPSWLVKLAKEQHKDKEWLSKALKNCTEFKKGNSDAYIYFVDSKNANQPEADWQFETNLTLQSPVEGFLILDILKNNVIGGVEFYDKLK